MKRILIVLTMLLMSVGLWGVDVYSFGSLGFYPNYYNSALPRDSFEDRWDTNLGVGVSQDVGNFTFYAETEYITEMNKILNKHTWSPDFQDYRVGAGIIFKAIGIHYEHLCEHDIDINYLKRGRTYDRVYIDFDTRRLR